MKFLLMLFTLCFLPCSIGYTQEAVQSFPTGIFDDLKRGDMVKVSAIVDPQTIQLDNGTIMRLVGIRMPDFGVYEVGDYALTAKKILTDMLQGETVQLYITPKKDWGRVNRMGHTLAHIERQSDKAWIQGTLISLGLAQVGTGQRNPEMAAQMYALEAAARAEKLGIWESDTYKIITPEDTPDHLKTIQIVEGHVESVARRNSRTYINFGKDWRTDFTVSIKSGDKRLFSKAGINPMDWGGQTIRVRGWLDEYNGPYIQISHPEAVEVISE